MDLLQLKQLADAQESLMLSINNKKKEHTAAAFVRTGYLTRFCF